MKKSATVCSTQITNVLPLPIQRDSVSTGTSRLLRVDDGCHGAGGLPPPVVALCSLCGGSRKLSPLSVDRLFDPQTHGRSSRRRSRRRLLERKSTFWAIEGSVRPADAVRSLDRFTSPEIPAGVPVLGPVPVAEVVSVDLHASQFPLPRLGMRTCSRRLRGFGRIGSQGRIGLRPNAVEAPKQLHFLCRALRMDPQIC